MTILRKPWNAAAAAIIGTAAMATPAYGQDAPVRKHPMQASVAAATGNSNANNNDSPRRLTRAERNKMSVNVKIASGKYANESYAYLMDDDTSGTGFYRLLLDRRTDDMPDDVLWHELDRFRKNTIVFLSFYYRGDDPLMRKQFSDEHRRFSRVYAEYIAGIASTPVVLIEVCARDDTKDHFLAEMGEMMDTYADNWDISDSQLKLLKGLDGTFVAHGGMYLPNKDGPPVVYSYEMSGKHTADFLGNRLNENNDDVVDADVAIDGELALNRD